MKGTVLFSELLYSILERIYTKVEDLGMTSFKTRHTCVSLVKSLYIPRFEPALLLLGEV